MSGFHRTTTTILEYVLAEQRADLASYQRRIEQADESTLRTAAERERFPRTMATLRGHVDELTAVVADFARLLAYVADSNVEAAELAEARAQVEQAAADRDWYAYTAGMIGSTDLDERAAARAEARAQAEDAALAEEQEDAAEQTFVGRYLVPADRADEARAQAEQGAANAPEKAVGLAAIVPFLVAEARHFATHDPATCTECSDPDDEDGDESRFTRAQLDGEACTECSMEFAEGEPTVPSAYDLIEEQLLAHLRCVADDGEPMTNRDVDPENVAECDAYADAYCDFLAESGGETR